MDEVKILPWMGYSQLQAMAFGLNHTQAIIMNYIASSIPFWADEKIIDGKKYRFCASSKFLSDMPTLDIGRTTLIKNVNVLIEKGLVERKIIGNRVPHFRMTEKWVYGSPTSVQNMNAEPFKMGTLYNTKIINQIKKEKDGNKIAEDLIKELSSYLESEEGISKKHVNTFSLDDVKGGLLVNILRDHLIALRDGKSTLKLESKKTIDKDYINEIVKTVIDIGDRFGKIEWVVKGTEKIPSQRSLAEIVTEMEKLLNWYAIKGRVIKDLNATCRNWFLRVFNK